VGLLRFAEERVEGLSHLRLRIGTPEPGTANVQDRLPVKIKVQVPRATKTGAHELVLPPL
jgi:hypothetical protein